LETITVLWIVHQLQRELRRYYTQLRVADSEAPCANRIGTYAIYLYWINQRYALKITATEFQQNVGRHQDEALQAPVAITKNCRPHTVLVSAAFFELVTKGRIARQVADLDDDTLKAIAESAVPTEYAALDKVVKAWAP
jgi:hypothetical protein